MFANRRPPSSFVIFLICTFFVAECFATITKSSKTKAVTKSEPKSASIVQFDPCAPTQHALQRFSSDFILQNHDAVCRETAHKKIFEPFVMGYVTPWNNHGYDVAKMFTNKFNFISPVWLQIMPDQASVGSYQIKGTHDVDSGWTQTLRTANPSLKIVPRIILEGMTSSAFHELTSGKKNNAWSNFAQRLVDLAKKYDFDGFVAEFWSVTQHNPKVKDNFCEFLIFVAKELHKAGKSFTLVIPPPTATAETNLADENEVDSPESFDRPSFNRLADHVDYFSLMTYDYSVRLQAPGPNAPLWWMKKSVQNLVPENSEQFREKRLKILMGLNFYGYLFDAEQTGGAGVQALIGNTVLEMLRKGNDPNSPGVIHVEWLEKDAEHFIDFHSDAKRASHMSRNAKALFFPTLESIRRRLILALDLGVGISIWEMGQGHDVFYNLL